MRYLSEILSAFDNFLQVERNLSPRSRHAYVFEARKLVEFLIRSRGKEPSCRTIKQEDLIAYLNYLQLQRGYSSSTIMRTLSALRALFRYCQERGVIEEVPTEGIHSPRLPRRLPVYLVEDELRRLLQAPFKFEKDPFLAQRNHTLLVLMAFGGLRLSELVGLELSQVDLQRRVIRVMGKGRKERIIPLNRIVQRALEDYLKIRPVSTQKSMFLSNKGRRLTGRMVEYIVKKYVRLEGLKEKPISPHKLRHTFATLLHLSDVDLLEIQALLGHASVQSTQIYTHTNPERLRQAVEKLKDL